MAFCLANHSLSRYFAFRPAPLDEQSAIAWFQQSLAQYAQSSEQSSAAQQSMAMPQKGISRKMQKRYAKVAKAKPQLEHLYIDNDFRLIKSIREKTQRPSYTIAVRR